jgi:hypothetical protein
MPLQPPTSRRGVPRPIGSTGAIRSSSVRLRTQAVNRSALGPRLRLRRPTPLAMLPRSSHAAAPAWPRPTPGSPRRTRSRPAGTNVVHAEKVMVDDAFDHVERSPADGEPADEVTRLQLRPAPHRGSQETDSDRRQDPGRGVEEAIGDDIDLNPAEGCRHQPLALASNRTPARRHAAGSVGAEGRSRLPAQCRSLSRFAQALLLVE